MRELGDVTWEIATGQIYAPPEVGAKVDLRSVAHQAFEDVLDLEDTEDWASGDWQ